MRSPWSGVRQRKLPLRYDRTTHNVGTAVVLDAGTGPEGVDHRARDGSRSDLYPWKRIDTVQSLVSSTQQRIAGPWQRVE